VAVFDRATSIRATGLARTLNETVFTPMFGDFGRVLLRTGEVLIVSPA
jgi:hypothetical protein